MVEMLNDVDILAFILLNRVREISNNVGVSPMHLKDGPEASYQHPDLSI